jgi:hypothetical protein
MFTWGGRGYGRTCATRDDEPRPVWTSLPINADGCAGKVFLQFVRKGLKTEGPGKAGVHNVNGNHISR